MNLKIMDGGLGPWGWMNGGRPHGLLLKKLNF